MNKEVDKDAFRQVGFKQAKTGDDRFKFIRGCCEIYVNDCSKTGITIEIPVAKLPGYKEPSGLLYNYLLERNGTMKGPGYFCIRNETIWFRAVLPGNDNISAIALQMQETVERLGPRIMNLL